MQHVSSSIEEEMSMIIKTSVQTLFSKCLHRIRPIIIIPELRSTFVASTIWEGGGEGGGKEYSLFACDNLHNTPFQIESKTASFS